MSKSSNNPHLALRTIQYIRHLLPQSQYCPSLPRIRDNFSTHWKHYTLLIALAEILNVLASRCRPSHGQKKYNGLNITLDIHESLKCCYPIYVCPKYQKIFRHLYLVNYPHPNRIQCYCMIELWLFCQNLRRKIKSDSLRRMLQPQCKLHFLKALMCKCKYQLDRTCLFHNRRVSILSNHHIFHCLIELRLMCNHQTYKRLANLIWCHSLTNQD